MNQPTYCKRKSRWAPTTAALQPSSSRPKIKVDIPDPIAPPSPRSDGAPVQGLRVRGSLIDVTAHEPRARPRPRGKGQGRRGGGEAAAAAEKKASEENAEAGAVRPHDLPRGHPRGRPAGASRRQLGQNHAAASCWKAASEVERAPAVTAAAVDRARYLDERRMFDRKEAAAKEAERGRRRRASVRCGPPRGAPVASAAALRRGTRAAGQRGAARDGHGSRRAARPPPPIRPRARARPRAAGRGFRGRPAERGAA